MEARERAAGFLKAQLNSGVAVASDLVMHAEALGISRSTLYRAKNRLNLDEGRDEDGRHVWIANFEELPE